MLACSAFDAAPASTDDGGIADAAAPVDAADGVDSPAPPAVLDAGCGVVSFTNRFSRPGDPLFDGWDKAIGYGAQDSLDIQQVPDAGVSGDGVLRIRANAASETRGKVFVHGIAGADLACVGVEMRFRVDAVPSGSDEGVLTSVLRFATKTVLSFTLAANGDLQIAQQEESGGGTFSSLGQAKLSVGAWHVARLVYRAGPVLSASLDGVELPLDQSQLLPLDSPNRFDVGVTYAPAQSTFGFDIDEVSVF